MPPGMSHSPRPQTRSDSLATLYTQNLLSFSHRPAQMVKLVDTQDLKFCSRKAVWVRFPLWALKSKNTLVVFFDFGLRESKRLSTVSTKGRKCHTTCTEHVMFDSHSGHMNKKYRHRVAFFVSGKNDKLLDLIICSKYVRNLIELMYKGKGSKSKY